MTWPRTLIGLAALVAGIYVIETLLDSFGGGTPGGPTASSYATGADGTAAWAELLARNGHPVSRLRVTPRRARLAPGDTAVVLDPPFVLAADVDALTRFVRTGGRLIAGGPDATLLLRRIVTPHLNPAAGGVRTALPLAPVPEVASVRTVETGAEGSWSEVGPALPILGSSRKVVAAVANVGRGRVVLVADDSMLQNAFLAHADNAAFGLDIAGARRRPVAFFESYHGYGTSHGTGLSALPSRWRELLALGFATAVVYMLARLRRLGPADREERELPPPRREYVEAMAGILARTHDPTQALEPMRVELRRRLQAGSTELSDEEKAAVARATVTGQDVLPLGRAFARLGGGRGRPRS